MSTETRKECKLRLRSRETTAGTEDTYDFFEASSVVMTKPPSMMLQERDVGKLGAGEFGTRAETQATYSPFTLKCSRLTEVFYFLSYCLGETDSAITISSDDDVYSHEVKHLGIASRTVPTFTALYVDGSRTWLMTHCIITSFSINYAIGNTGIIDATFTGVCNMTRKDSGVFSIQQAATTWVSGEYTDTIAAESLLNYKNCSFYIGSSTESTPLVHASIDYTSSDLTGGENISKLVNSISITGTNNLVGEEALRAGDSGILNNQERKDFTFTVEINARKDDALPVVTNDATHLADTLKALEICWQGKTITSPYRYSMKMFFPSLCLDSVKEDDESPINQTLSYKVLADSEGAAMSVYVQNMISESINKTFLRDDFAPHTMTGATSPTPYVASASSEYWEPGTGVNFYAYRAFDGAVGVLKYWLNDGLTQAGWVKIDLGSGNEKVLHNYSVQVNTIPEPTRAPKVWTVQGSNDDATWSTLDTVTGQTDWSSGETRDFICDIKNTAYRYFRINITENNGDTYLQLAELYLYGY